MVSIAKKKGTECLHFHPSVELVLEDCYVLCVRDGLLVEQLVHLG